METPYVNIHTHRPTGRGLEPASVGIHPWDAAGADADSLCEALGRAQAVGEIGLDYLHPDREAQRRLFEQQLELAETAGMPVVLHCVKAFEPMMTLLGRFRLRAVIFHGFIGSPQQAARAVAAGYYLSFGPRSLRSPRTVQALATVPSERLFLETDDDPTPIESVYAEAARLLGLPLDRLREALYTNYLRIFT
ncbi:TatD family hydrolase [Alistipes sp.]|uniref:TatD family hydrolase n=1 Tax=Alistipes sp. TaxID=1872444 RepID=UPI003A83CE3E